MIQKQVKGDGFNQGIKTGTSNVRQTHTFVVLKEEDSQQHTTGANQEQFRNKDDEADDSKYKAM